MPKEAARQKRLSVEVCPWRLTFARTPKSGQSRVPGKSGKVQKNMHCPQQPGPSGFLHPNRMATMDAPGQPALR